MTAAVLSGSVLIVFLISLALGRVEDRVDTTHDVIDSLRDTLSTLKDAETGERGYILTGNKSYLQPYNDAVKRVVSDLQSLKGYAAGRELPAGDVASLETLVQNELAELLHTIDLRAGGSRGFDDALNQTESGRGKQIMDQIRLAVIQLVELKNHERDLDRATARHLGIARMVVYLIVGLINIAFLRWARLKIHRGIAQREVAAAELREQKELLAVTLSSIGDGVIVTDAQGRITFINPEAERLTGWSAAEAQRQPCQTVFNIISETTRAKVESPVEKVLRTGGVAGLANHTLLLGRDGSELPIDDSGAPIRNTDGTIYGVVLVFRDFSEHKAQEKKVTDAYVLLETVTNSTQDLIFAKDREGRMLFANAATQRTVGKSMDELMNQTEAQWHSDADQAAAIMAIDRQIMASGKPHSVEEVFTGPQGKRIYISTKSPITDRSGIVTGLVGVARDTTEQNLVQAEMLRAKEVAETANLAKDNFLATLSHELRTPLTPVLATLSLWESNHDLPAAMLADVQLLRRNVELEARLIDDLLDLTRIVKGKLPLNLETADVHALISSVAEIYKSEINAKRLRLSMNFQAGEHHVSGDPARLQQVFWNILKNAAKFTAEGGEIRVESLDDARGKLQLTFSDTGIGMTGETIARLFLPFEQGSAEMVRQYGGLGLGMAISRTLLEAQSGEIKAQSEGPGKGATFTVTLTPVAAPSILDVKQPVTPVTRQESTKLNILLVEDHADTARVMGRILRGMGHEVRIAGSVASALESAQEPFDLLLSDIGLPDGTGADLIRRIRQQFGDQHTAIALTGFGMEEDIIKCRDAGFNEHLTKPVSVQKLELAIQRAAASRRLS